MIRFAAKYVLVALSLVGSAILLYSCGSDEEDTAAADEVMMTEYSENLSIVKSQNGRRSYHFETPLVEGYSLAREPYREFRKGVKITTFMDDSLSTVDAVLTANYAIYYENRKLWEAKGNVVIVKSDGTELYTQQLFWNALTKRIYSNVDTKIVRQGGADVGIGEGFESDEEFKDWRFRRMKSRMEVDFKPTDNADSTAAAATPSVASVPSAPGSPAPDASNRSAAPAKLSEPLKARPGAQSASRLPIGAAQPEQSNAEAQRKGPNPEKR